MTLNQIKQAAEIAKARTSDRRWNAAIDKAVVGFESWIITELATCLAITTESGNTYFANGVCQCEAYKRSTACKHRALYRLYAIAQEMAQAVSFTADVAESPRQHLEIEIENLWSRVEPTVHLADALMARFKVNSLSFLSDSTLKDIRLALAA